MHQYNEFIHCYAGTTPSTRTEIYQMKSAMGHTVMTTRPSIAPTDNLHTITCCAAFHYSANKSEKCKCIACVGLQYLIVKALRITALLSLLYHHYSTTACSSGSKCILTCSGIDLIYDLLYALGINTFIHRCSLGYPLQLLESSAQKATTGSESQGQTGRSP